MTAGQSYSVDVVYTGRDHGATATADSISGRLVALQGRIDSVVGAFDSMARGAAMLGVGAAMMGVRALYHGVTSLNARAEETTLTIAGMLNANHAAPNIIAGMGDAQEAMRAIRRDAAALPGEAHEFIAIFQTGLPAALQAGMRTGLDVARFTNQFGAVGKAFGVDAGQIGRDLRFMLQGHAGGQVAMWNHLGPIIGKTAHQFNAMTAPQRLAAIQTATGRFGGMIQQYGNTWEAASSTIQSAGSELLRIGTAPLFETAKGKVVALADYLTRNAPALEATATALGRRLAHGFDEAYARAAHLVTYVRNNWDRIVADGRREVTALARDYAALQMSSHAIAGARAFGASAAPLLSAGAGAGGAAAVGVAGVVAATALVAAAPAVAALASGSYDASRIAQTFGDSLEGAGRDAGQLRQVWGPLTTQIGGDTLEGIRVLTGAAGSLTAAFLGLSSMASNVGNEFSLSRGAMEGFTRGLYTASTGLLGLPAILGRMSNDWQKLQDQLGWNRDRHLMGSGTAGQRIDAMRSIGALVADHRLRAQWTGGSGYGDAFDNSGGDGWRVDANALARAHNTGRPANPDTHARRGHTTIHNNFRIEQADNPERVALTVVHMLQREMRHPTQARVPGVMTLRPVGH